MRLYQNTASECAVLDPPPPPIPLVLLLCSRATKYHHIINDTTQKHVVQIITDWETASLNEDVIKQIIHGHYILHALVHLHSPMNVLV